MLLEVSMALEPAKLSDFKVAGALGTGTTARVYEAVHTASGRPVAIKVMEQSASGAEMRERFAREALLLSGVDSRHVSKILGFGFDRGQPFLVLERLHGETLDAKLRRDGPVPAPIAVRWIEQLIVGVRDCHDAQVIHRDIKPSNIFLHHDGFDETVKLIDFGVARLREIAGDSGGLTSTNHLIGSMGYMAPEQFKSAKSVGFPADLYAVGVVIFRTLTGRLPFVSRSLEAVIKMKQEQIAPPISSMAGMPQNQMLDWFVHKAMAREAEDRFQGAREMLEQWWMVMSSLDEAGAMNASAAGDFGRVDESYAGRMPRPPTAPPPTIDDDSHPANDDDRTIRRPPRVAVPLPSGASGGGAPQSVTAENAMPMMGGGGGSNVPDSPRAMSHALSSDRTMRDEQGGGAAVDPQKWEQAAPHTIPSQDLDLERLNDRGEEFEHDPINDTAVHMDPIRDDQLLDDDPFDLPTRNDPNLRKLVERELELQKARKERG